jgi:hypothetical protein
MAQTAPILDPEGAHLETGTVYQCVAAPEADRPVTIATRSGVCRAAVAASCLLRPAQGDTVLVAHLEDGASVILSVLFRNRDAGAFLDLPGESVVASPGSLALRTGERLTMETGGAMHLASTALSMTADTCNVQVVRMRAVLDSLDACCRSIYLAGKALVSSFRSLTQLLGASRKVVEGDDEVRAGNATLVVDENATVLCRNGLTLAEQTARTDARLIQLG